MVAQTVKHLPAMWETQVRFLGWEDPLEKEMAIHSSTLAWKIPWTEKPDRLQSVGSQRVGPDWATSLSFTFTVTLIGQKIKGTFPPAPYSKPKQEKCFKKMLKKFDQFTHQVIRHTFFLFSSKCMPVPKLLLFYSMNLKRMHYYKSCFVILQEKYKDFKNSNTCIARIFF